MRMIRPAVARLCLSAAAMTAAMAPALAQPRGPCVPASARGDSKLGCFIIADQALGKLPGTPVYWYLDTYPDRKSAEAARGPAGTVVESLGKTWLFTIAGAHWRARGGRPVSRIGPLPLAEAESYEALYLEGSFEPGMVSSVHRHTGVAAWYTLAGSMCVETPQGRILQGAGGPGVYVPAGQPMEISGTGKGLRRSISLVLHDASKPDGSPAPDWQPKGLCKG